MKLYLWGKHWRSILINPLSFALNIVIKDPFFISCNYILEKQVISLIWKKTCCYGYMIFLILLTKCMGKLNAQVTYFSCFFQSQQIVDWNVLRSSANSQVLSYGLHSIILLKYLHQGMMSVLVSVHISMTYHQNKTLKTSFGLGSQYWHFDYKHNKFF